MEVSFLALQQIIYRVVQSSGTIFKRIVREIMWNRKCKICFPDSSPFPDDDIFTLLSLCVIV
jgi:hypothetical protein